MSEIKYRRVSGKFPICPHCKKEIREIEYIEQGIFKLTIVYMCPHCDTILSMATAP